LKPAITNRAYKFLHIHRILAVTFFKRTLLMGYREHETSNTRSIKNENLTNQPSKTNASIEITNHQSPLHIFTYFRILAVTFFKNLRLMG